MDRATRRVWAVLTAALLVTACGPGRGGHPGDAAPAPAGGVLAPSPSATAAWDELVAAARAEGLLVFAGPAVPEVRTRLPARFKERFGIEVEYLSSGSELATRMGNERASGLYTVDVVIGGPSTIPLIMFPAGMFDPIRDVLVIPDVEDASKWVRGRPWYFDPEERYLVRLVDKISHAFTINAGVVDPAQLATPQDLLDPRWKGRIAGGDYSRSAGSGMSKALLMLKVLGEDFLREFYLGQEVKVTADERLLADWVGHGTYPLVVGMADTDQFKLRADGVQVQSVKMRHKVQAERNAGAGVLGLINQAPHPNAAKLFVNWMLTQEAMQIFSAAARVPMIRTDVDYANVDPDILPEREFEYVDMSDWNLIVNEQVPLQRRVTAVLGGGRSLAGRRHCRDRAATTVWVLRCYGS